MESWANVLQTALAQNFENCKTFFSFGVLFKVNLMQVRLYINMNNFQNR